MQARFLCTLETQHLKGDYDFPASYIVRHCLKQGNPKENKQLHASIIMNELYIVIILSYKDYIDNCFPNDDRSGCVCVCLIICISILNAFLHIWRNGTHGQPSVNYSHVILQGFPWNLIGPKCCCFHGKLLPQRLASHTPHAILKWDNYSFLSALLFLILTYSSQTSFFLSSHFPLFPVISALLPRPLLFTTGLQVLSSWSAQYLTSISWISIPQLPLNFNHFMWASQLQSQLFIFFNWLCKSRKPLIDIAQPWRLLTKITPIPFFNLFVFYQWL